MSDFTTNHRFLVPTNIQSMSGSLGRSEVRAFQGEECVRRLGFPKPCHDIANGERLPQSCQILKQQPDEAFRIGDLRVPWKMNRFSDHYCTLRHGLLQYIRIFFFQLNL